MPKAFVLHLPTAARNLTEETVADLKGGDYGKVMHSLSSAFKTVFLGHPHSVTIEPINICNLDCEFCSSPPALIKREKRAMSATEFRCAVDSLRPYTHHLWLFLVGEPFLNPALPEMLSYANSRNMHVTVSTNATTLTPKTISAIVSSGLDRLIISLDGTTKTTYEKMRRGGNFLNVIENIKCIANEKKKMRSLKPVVELQMIVTKINEHEADGFAKFTKDLGAERSALKTLAIPEWVHGRRKVQMLRKKFLPEKGESRYTEDFKLKGTEGCIFTKRSIVLADGTVCMCCYDIQGDYSFGNIFSRPFGDVWKSEKYTRTRKAMHKRALPLCKKCAGI
ncbi:radical SAM protein [Candidatus Micrarchaeota archaeon]|nr:radical SAM protein [Candidatus Micrarchaeota archaeon]